MEPNWLARSAEFPERQMSHIGPSRTISRLTKRWTRRNWLATTAGTCGISLPAFLQLRAAAAPGANPPPKAKSCIIVYCWGGMSHHETWDPKPDAPAEVRGEFLPISTAT